MELEAGTEVLAVAEGDAVQNVEVAFQVEAVVETDSDAVGHADTVELEETDAEDQAGAETDVIGLIASESMGRAAAAPCRNSKGGLTGPVRAGEAEVMVTEVRPVAAAEEHGPSSVQTPAAPPIEETIVSIL